MPTITAAKTTTNPQDGRLKRWGYLFSIPAILWLMLWFSINTGPGAFDREPQDFVDWINAIRSNFHYVVALVGLIYLVIKHSSVNILSGPVRMWLIYGLIGLFATLMSPEPMDALYWAVAYLAVLLAMRAYMSTSDPLDTAEQLNRLNWMITTLFLLILVFFARDYLMPVIIEQKSGYSLYGQIQTVAAMPMSRSSGMARFAAVPGVIAFVMLWHSQGLKRLFWIALFFASAYLIYMMQSRGAIFGMAFAMSFVLLFQGKRSRIFGIIFVSLFGLMLLTDVIPVENVNAVKDYLYRGQSEEDFRSMTGRTRAWDLGLATGLESPMIGWGFQADRFLIKEHVHNTYLYAFMTSGFPGLLAFISGLAWAWLLFFKIMRKYTIENAARKLFLIQAGGILAFFTVRSIPEVCGALFAVDYMIMLPILAYLNILHNKLKNDAEAKAKEKETRLKQRRY
jgi:O-antigen ligase